MKKTLLTCLLAALAICAVSCAKTETAEKGASTAGDLAVTENETEEPENYAGMASPVTDYTSLEDLNAVNGSHLAKPAAMGVSDEKFASIDCGDYTIAQYIYTCGHEFTLRNALVTDADISGVYLTEGKTAFEDVPVGNDKYDIVSNDEYKLARWFTLDGQYVLICQDNGDYTDEGFAAIADEMYWLTNIYVKSPDEQAAFYGDISGLYADSVSQRAMLTAVANNADNMFFTVTWGNSAFDTVEWTMTVTEAEDGLLVYSDCTESHVSYAEDGTETREVNYENGEGYFSFDAENGKLLWNGAADENCKECVFEKLEISIDDAEAEVVED